MPTKENLADRNVTTTELAAVLGITGRRVQQLTQDGVLVTASRGKFVLSDAVQAYIGSISRGGLTKEEAEEAVAFRLQRPAFLMKGSVPHALYCALQKMAAAPVL